jgi:hypothetical protein
MTRRRHTPEQIIRKLREADRLLGEGADAQCRGQGVAMQFRILGPVEVVGPAGAYRSARRQAARPGRLPPGARRAAAEHRPVGGGTLGRRLLRWCSADAADLHVGQDRIGRRL